MTAHKLVTRIGGRLSALMLGGITGVTGLLPPRIRYGYVHRITRFLLQKPLRAVDALGAAPDPRSTVQVAPTGNLTCVLAAGALDVGGIGSVVEHLATMLPTLGITPVVVCCDDGARARRLRDLGIAVCSVTGYPSALRAIRECRPDVIQLHGTPDFLESAAQTSGAPLVPVLHNTEIHYTRARWRRLAVILRRSSSAVAVSELVRAFHATHLPADLASRLTVIPNAVPGIAVPDPQLHSDARNHLEHAVGGRFNRDVVFLCLARYDAQKNIAGTVASFLDCVAAGLPAQLVVAGEPSDWVEFRRADAIRRGSRQAHRVHLLGVSDAQTLLAAADVFVLNSFFEGWPVAATEAWSAGLPLIVSDVGGARELVKRDPDRSVLVSNETGDAHTVTDARVERARWRSRHQRNSAELGDAIRCTLRTVRHERASALRPQDRADGVDVMIALHASVLRDALRDEISDDPDRPGRFPSDVARGTVAT